jgi:hypothetical protein
MVELDGTESFDQVDRWIDMEGTGHCLYLY